MVLTSKYSYAAETRAVATNGERVEVGRIKKQRNVQKNTRSLSKASLYKAA